MTIQYEAGQASNVTIAYIGGGSRYWAWGLMSDLADEASMSGTMRLYDIDFAAAESNARIGNSLRGRGDVKAKWDYVAVGSIEEALSGADFVIMSILPGTFDDMHSDVHAPEKYGIYQSVADTVGPGGLVRALRTIPIYADYALQIKKYCPDAWVINFTNPMTLCTRVLYEVFPEIKAFGNCHEVFSSQLLMADMLRELRGIENVRREDIKVNILGVNHFTWIDSATYQGIDLFPVYKEFVDKYYETGYETKKDKERTELDRQAFGSKNRVKFDLFRRYGVIAAAGDRHLAEALPPSWYIKDPETAAKWQFALTSVPWRKRQLEARLETRRKLESGEEQMSLKKSGEEGMRQIKALLGLEDLVSNVNLPNKGQYEGVPAGAVVETNALFRKQGVSPIVSGKLPDELQHLVLGHVTNQETILRAALAKDKELAFKAFINDPLVVPIGVDDARKLFDEMLGNTKHLLPGWDL